MDASPHSTPPADPDREEDDLPPTLSRLSFALILGVTLGIFFLLHPLWERPDIEAVDGNIWFSYAPIPLLVLLALAWERKLRAASWFLETLKLTLLKFGVTYVVANFIWFVDAPPPAPAVTREREPPSFAEGVLALHAAPAPTLLDARLTGVLAGRVSEASGAPRAEAFVYVSKGLRRHVFAPPSEPALLHHADGGFLPRVLVVQAHQELLLRSTSDVLHTAELFESSGRPLANLPAVAGGEHRLMFAREHGLLGLRCRVGAHVEEEGRLLVLAHPFVTRSDAEGRFRLEGVPAGELELSVWTGAGAPETLAVTLAPGEQAQLDFVGPPGIPADPAAR